MGSAAAADSSLSIAYGGRQRSALVHIPLTYDKQKPLPLVTVLHGKRIYVIGMSNGAIMAHRLGCEKGCWPGEIPGIRYGNIDKPTTEISATETMVEFFLAHPKNVTANDWDSISPARSRQRFRDPDR
ncbi:MAG: hypothetical protein ABI569_01515 [Casimicrobiaceae bacterium]